jgi:hypothetical protein
MKLPFPIISILPPLEHAAMVLFKDHRRTEPSLLRSPELRGI